MASAHLANYPFDVVYVAGGACDITSKDKATNRISFKWNPPQDVAVHLLGSLRTEDSFISNNHPASRVVFCPLVGSKLSRVVNAHDVSLDQQSAVDNAIFEFNMEIFKINKKRDTFSPSLHRSIHRSNGKVRKCHYHLLDDGLHLSEQQLTKWAGEFVKATSHTSS